MYWVTYSENEFPIKKVVVSRTSDDNNNPEYHFKEKVKKHLKDQNYTQVDNFNDSNSYSNQNQNQSLNNNLQSPSQQDEIKDSGFEISEIPSSKNILENYSEGIESEIINEIQTSNNKNLNKNVSHFSKSNEEELNCRLKSQAEKISELSKQITEIKLEKQGMAKQLVSLI